MKSKVNLGSYRLAIVTVLILISICGLPNSAWAHARLVRAAPKQDGEVAHAPAEVELWFNELLDNGFNSILIFSAADDKSRKNLADGDAVIDEKDHTHLTVKVPSLPTGEYVVEWSVLSLDGHTARGKFKFKIRPG